jgi:D-alanyl-D-alanine carboxypeptidase/D-alanyl-D-alanine-endopeptidase (penicillin-binding protein 4)
VVDLKTRRHVAALRAAELFIPASNQKLLTSAFALERLGADFRFATGVFLLGEDVVVAGDGDPTLGDPRLAAAAERSIYAELDRWSAAVRKRAGTKVRDVLLCEPPGRPPRHPDWPAAQRRRWYVAPVGTLNFHDNCFDVTFAHAGGALAPIVRPHSRLLRVVSRLKMGREHLWSLRLSARDAVLTLTGTVARATDDPMSVAVDHPALLLGRVLAERLARAGVAVTGKVRCIAPGDVRLARARPICRTTTPLFTVMHRANKRSLNMAAEALFLRAGDGTWAGSAQMLARTLTRTCRLPRGGLRSADGGGLSRRNGVSPAAMTTLLSAIARRRDAMVLLMSLPLGGVDGTLADRFNDAPCRGRIAAKSGYLYGVSCLSGYVLNEKGTVRFAFSVLVNGFTGGPAPAKRLQEEICRMVIDSVPRAAAG